MTELIKRSTGHNTHKFASRRPNHTAPPAIRPQKQASARRNGSGRQPSQQAGPGRADAGPPQTPPLPDTMTSCLLQRSSHRAGSGSNARRRRAAITALKTPAGRQRLPPTPHSSRPPPPAIKPTPRSAESRQQATSTHAHLPGSLKHVCHYSARALGIRGESTHAPPPACSRSSTQQRSQIADAAARVLRLRRNPLVSADAAMHRKSNGPTAHRTGVPAPVPSVPASTPSAHAAH